MSIIGQRIKELRIERGITQEKLGQLIGVTTQAVSKWERGGTPDAEILPSVADAFGVSVDSLFGRAESKSLETEITYELGLEEQKEAFRKAFSFCWSVETGLTGLNSLKDKFTSDMLDTLRDEYGHNYYSKLLTDNGLVCARLSEDCQYFFLMPEPSEGLREYLSDTEQLSDTFSLLADKDIINIIFYMYQRMNTPVSLSCIARNINKTDSQTEILMKKLCDRNLASFTSVETENGSLKTYTYRQECSLIPLLIYAKELRAEKTLDFLALFNRTKPLF